MKKIPSLKYSQAHELWSQISLNTNDHDSQIVVNDTNIICVLDNGILIQFDYFGNYEEIASVIGKIDLIKKNIYYVTNEKLHKSNQILMDCNGDFLIDEKTIFACTNFIDNTIIISYKDNRKLYKSKLIPQIVKLEKYQENILIPLPKKDVAQILQNS